MEYSFNGFRGLQLENISLEIFSTRLTLRYKTVSSLLT